MSDTDVMKQMFFPSPVHVLCCFSLQHGACVNAMDLWQFTPLHEAASKNRVEVCSLLLSHGADPTLLNCHSKSAVDMAPTPELKERLTCEFSLSHLKGFISRHFFPQRLAFMYLETQIIRPYLICHFHISF